MKKSLIISLLIVCKLYAQTTDSLINGVFIINQTKYIDLPQTNCNQVKTTNSVAAYFTYQPTKKIVFDNFEKAGNVKFNNNPLNYNKDKKFYSEVNVASIESKNWKISGHKDIPNMNFMYNGNLPSFTINANVVGNSIKKNDTLIITLNNIQLADSISIRVTEDNRLPQKKTVYFLSPNYSNTYYLPPNLLSSLSIGPRALIEIEAISYKYQTVAGKKYLFKNSFTFVKTGLTITN